MNIKQDFQSRFFFCKVNVFSIDKYLEKYYNRIGDRMIVNTKEMLEKAKKERYAVPHFNINNLEWTRFILEVCEEEKTPVIIGVSEGAISYMGGEKTVADLVRNLVFDLNIKVPVAIHLDHGSSVESCKKCIDAGFTSVMIDASKYTLDENINLVKQVVEYAHPKGITVEAEIGHVGGVEDNVSSDIAYATIDDATTLVAMTRIDTLAPAVGSAHGIYKGIPRIDYLLITKISESTNLPLVLHGGSGIPDDIIKKSIECGITKLNINTDLQVVWTKAVRQHLNEDHNMYDPRKVIKSGEAAMKETIREKIALLGSANKA